RLKSWRLKHYFDREHQPQELIDTEIPSQPLPFSLRTPDEAVTGKLNGALSPEIVWGPAVGDLVENSRYVKKAEGLLFQNDKVQRLAPKNIAAQPVYDGDFRYAGVDDNYFMTAALAPGPSKVTFQALAIPPAGDSKEPPRELVAYAIAPLAGGAPI